MALIPTKHKFGDAIGMVTPSAQIADSSSDKPQKELEHGLDYWSITVMLTRPWQPILFVLVVLLTAGCGLINTDATAVPDASSQPSTDNGTIIITIDTEPASQAGSFTFTGVPTGTVTADNTLVVSDLEPGTYTTTEQNPAPDFDVTAVQCDDAGSPTASSGDPQTRTAVINLDVGETVTCTFTNAMRATAVVVGQTEPDGASGQIQFTGVPSGTIPTNGTLVVSNLQPGTYTTTEVDPAPQFDLTAVSCDDSGSATSSSGDPATRTAVFNLDPGEMVRCTFVNTRRGTAVIRVETDPEDSEGAFTFTGVPTGTVSAGSELIVANLSPGTYTSTEVDPAPEYEIVEVNCDDGNSARASQGDPTTRTAVLNIDPGETVTCTFLHETTMTLSDGAATGNGGATGAGGTPAGGDGDGDGINPFTNPDPNLPNFPLPDNLPTEAGSYNTPRPGPWLATNQAGQIDCGVTVLAMDAGPVERGRIEVLDDGATIIASGLSDAESGTITLTADPTINGRYLGVYQAIEQGMPMSIDYYWQLVTDEYIIGYLMSTFTAEGISCTLYRPFELRYDG